MKKFIKKTTNSNNYFKNYCDLIIDIDWKKSNFNRISLINKAINKFNNCNYLEIGCDKNECFDSIATLNKIGVDPESGGTIRETSDEFFSNNKNIFDVIFVDGLHTFDQCRKDVINSLNCLNLNGYIFIHDLIPRNWLEEHIPRLQTLWTGDVWKVGVELSVSQGIDFNVVLADHGVGIIKKINKITNYKDRYIELKDLRFKDYFNFTDKISFINPEEFI